MLLLHGNHLSGASVAVFDAHDEIWDVVNYVLSIPLDGQQSAYPTELTEVHDEHESRVAAKEY